MTFKGSVLVVDDNTDSRELLAEFLAFAGFEVTTAVTGIDAVTVARRVRPQVVLMDLAMPGLMDGWEATRRIKTDPSLRDTVVMAVTAHAFPPEREKAMHAGCQAVFTKPCDLPMIAAHVDRTIRDCRSLRNERPSKIDGEPKCGRLGNSG
jgi:two-component system, cell cycle response regulator DivK